MISDKCLGCIFVIVILGACFVLGCFPQKYGPPVKTDARGVASRPLSR